VSETYLKKMYKILRNGNFRVGALEKNKGTLCQFQPTLIIHREPGQLSWYIDGLRAGRPRLIPAGASGFSLLH
jgi:hypothetical protein